MSINVIEKCENLRSELESIIYAAGSWDGHFLYKKKNWKAIYLEYDDFHHDLDDILKSFFKEHFNNGLFLASPSFNDQDSDQNFYVIDSYNDFLDVWRKYLLDDITEIDSDMQFFALAFTCEQTIIFNDDLNWVFYNNPDMEISAILYIGSMEGMIRRHFSTYSKIQSLDEIREYIPNFATKGFKS